jgi:hypothetical protein
LKEHVLKHHTSEGAVKPSYRPRRKNNTVNKSSAAIDLPIDSINSSQLIITGDGADGEMTEQDVATANLIYEYTHPDGTTETRVVIQNMADFENGQAVVVEGDLKQEDDDSNEGQVIIHAYEATEDN